VRDQHQEEIIMSEVHRFLVDKIRLDNWSTSRAVYVVRAEDYDRVLAQFNQRDEELHSLEQRRHAEQQACQAAERRVAEFLAGASIEAAAKVLAECMDYPWEHMPENGRSIMRKHAKTVLDAAINPTAEAVSHE
jgi:hypothetical protein